MSFADQVSIANGIQPCKHLYTAAVSSHTPVQVFAGAGTIRYLKISNANGAAVAYLNYWDASSAPTPGTTALYDADSFPAGGGADSNPSLVGTSIASGLWISASTTRNGTTDAGAALDVTIGYDT